MIVDHENRLVIMTAPGTNADAIHRALAGIPGNVWVIGVNMDGWADSHTTRIPMNWDSYERAIVVRNPYTRLLRLREVYNEYRRTIEGRPKPYSLREFLDHRPRLTWKYSTSCKEGAAGFNPVRVLKYEKLGEELRTIYPGRRIRLELPQIENWRQHYRHLNYDRLVELYNEEIYDISYGYFDEAITPTLAAAYTTPARF